MSNITAFLTLSMDKVTYLLRPDEDGYPDVKMPRGLTCIYADIQSFTGNTLAISSHFPGVSYEHDITINEDNIQLTCSCGSPDFCFHIQGLLRHLVWKYGTDYFKQFRGFPFNDMEKYTKFFNVKYYYEKVIVEAKHEFGIIYNRGSKTIDARPKFWTEPLPIVKDEHTQIGYTLGIVNPIFDHAFLIPYQAILTSDKTEIKGYRRFMDLADPQVNLSADQRLLNSYCEDFNKLIASEADQEIQQDKQAFAELKEKNRHLAFGYWKKLVPLLMKQPYLHKYFFYKKIAYKLKPEKHSMLPITFSDEKVIFGLTLKEKKDHFKLNCQAYIKNKAFDIQHVLPPKSPFFFYLKKDDTVHYLFSNLKEAAIVNAFNYTGFELTILKEDLPQFNTNVLNEWTEEFPVTFKLSKKPSVMPLSVVQKQITVTEKDGTVYFTPSIVYDRAHTVNIFSNGSQILEVNDEDYVVLQRDKTAEKNFRTLFLKLFPFEEMVDQRVFFLPMAALNDPIWLYGLLGTLKSEGVSMLGLEDLTELNLDLSAPDVSIAVNADKDWFDITVAINYGEQSLTPEDIRKALKNSSKGLRLMNGKTAFLPDSFVKQLTPAFHNGQVTATGVKVAGRHYSLIDELFDSAHHPDLRNVIEEHKKVFDLSDQIPVIEVPANVNAILRPYQVAGFSWMCHLHSYKWGGLLADDMGLGKTLQVLTLLQYLKNNKLSTGPHLLIAPTSLLFNWKEEAAKFCPDLKVSTYYGLSRGKDLDRLMNYDLILTSYGTAMLDIEFLKDVPFDYLILDEAQAIKNPLSQRFKAMTMISAKYHLALTGTPVENSSTDLYALLSFANPGFFGSLKMFNNHMISKGDEEDDVRNQELLKTINPFILRRTKDKVATDLPPKTEMVL